MECMTFFKDKSDKWNDIGEALGISYNDRQIIRNNVDGNKLEAVLNKWIESKCSEVSWNHLIKTLEELKLCDSADKLRNHLLHDDNHQDGSTSIDDNTIPRNKAILQNQVLKTNYKQVTSVTETINILGTGQLHDLAGMPPQLISTKKSSYNEDKSNTETTNNQTDATSTMATEYNMKPVDVKDGSTSISNDGKPFPETSSRIGHIDPISHPGGQENNAINLPSNEKGISHSGDTCSALLKQVQDVNNELKQKVQKYEDERDSFFQREKDKLERDRNTLEKKEEEFERLMKVAKEKLEEDRKQLQNVREEQENDFNLKRQRSETELQEGIKKQKIEFEKQEKKQKRNANAEKKKISITENELDKKKEQLKLFEANLNDEKLKLNNGKKWVIDELNTKRFKLRKRHKRKQRLDEQEPVRKDEERVHKSSRKVKDKREWFWDENTILQQRKQRQNEENPRASVTN